MEPPFTFRAIVAMFLIGAVLGWLVSLTLKEKQGSIIGHVIVGLIGSFAGGYLTFEYLPDLGSARLAGGAVVGAFLLLTIVPLRK